MPRRSMELEIKTYIRLPKDIQETVERLAREKGLPVSQFLRMLVLERLKELKNLGGGS